MRIYLDRGTEPGGCLTGDVAALLGGTYEEHVKFGTNSRLDVPRKTRLE